MSALSGVAPEQVRRCVIAYEPIWAIGTGKTATGEQAAEVCTFIRATIRGLYGARIARSVTIQYGGSMNPQNAAELLSHENIDGGLIGGASLKPEQLMQFGMDGKQSLAKGEYTVFVGGGQPVYCDNTRCVYVEL